MPYGFESENSLTRNVASALSRNSIAPFSHRTQKEDTFRSARAHKKDAAAFPFNGLLTNKLLAALPGADFARLLPHFEPVSLSGGEDLYAPGDEVPFAYFPETAVISHLYILEDGSTTEAAIIGKDGMAGLSAILSSHQSSYWTQVTISGNALKVRTEVIREEFKRGETMQKLLLNYAGERIAQLSQRAVCNNRHKLEQRLCSWLLMIQDRCGEAQLPLTQEHIARHLGVRRAGITTAATALKDEGIISCHRGRISILDREALEGAACECYRTITPEVLNKVGI